MSERKIKNFEDMLTTNFIHCNNGCKDRIPIKEVSASKAHILLNDYEELERDRDKYKKALQDIIKPNQSSVGDYPVLKSDGEMIKIANEALRK